MSGGVLAGHYSTIKWTTQCMTGAFLDSVSCCKYTGVNTVLSRATTHLCVSAHPPIWDLWFFEVLHLTAKFVHRESKVSPLSSHTYSVRKDLSFGLAICYLSDK